MSLLSIKSIQLVFNRFPGYAYYCVLGFLAGSTYLAFPRLSLDFTLLIGILLFGTGCSYRFSWVKAPQIKEKLIKGELVC
jgi:uncharacterized membrane protein